MNPNTSTGLYVATGSHRYPVRAWTDEGVPLIAGVAPDRLAEPTFDNWTLEDDGILATQMSERDHLRQRAFALHHRAAWTNLTEVLARIEHDVDLHDARMRIEYAEAKAREVVLRSLNWPGL